MARYNGCQGLVPGRGPAVEKHWCRQQIECMCLVSWHVFCILLLVFLELLYRQ